MGGRLLRWSAGTAVIVAVLGGCSDGRSPARAVKTPSSPAARPAQPASAITQDRLQGALLQNFGKLTAFTTPKNGPYDALPAADVAAGALELPSGVAVKPSKCSPVLWSGPAANVFGKAPSAAVVLRKPGDTSAGGVQAWDELVALNGQAPQAVLGTGPKTGCDTIHVGAGKSTLTFEEIKLPALGKGARGAQLTPSSPDSRRTWVVTFLGQAYAGVILMQGPVTQDDVKAFAMAAYKNADQKLG